LTVENATPRVAIVHEWLTEWGGSEDVVRLMLECAPGASLSATIDFLSAANRARLKVADIQTTFLQKAPFVEKRFWNYLPLTPLAVESLDLRAADLIVSSSHAFAKGVLTTGQQLHVSYVHSPMRYAWDLHHQYLADYKLDTGLKGLLARWMFQKLRMWDRQTANNVDLFLANSRHVQQRIWRAYRRRSRVLYPPVRTSTFRLEPIKEDFYVTVSRLVSYKRIDLIVDAFRAMPGRKLVVIGAGPELDSIRRSCPPNVELMGWQSDAVVQEYLGRAKAFVFAAHEDFGISPVEALACGTPVIAYGIGGAAETVRNLHHHPQPTGVLFPAQTAAAIGAAVDHFEAAGSVFDPDVCRAWAETFSEERFRREFSDVMERAWALWRRAPLELEPALVDGP
jgi:glycosyltransferase involved in cell wall biosynthesis